MTRRGDNIPDISEYSHWNEDAYYMWYQENKYDMEHADEIIEDDEPIYEDDEPDFYEAFDTEAEAQVRYEWACEQFANASKSNNGKCWFVEAWK